MCEKEEKECQETKLDDECKDEDLKDPLDELRKFLKSKFFPDKFIKEIFEKGVTEDIQETLEAYKLTCEEISFICEELKKKKIKHIDSCDCFFQSETDVTSRESNADTNYLKEHFGNVLSAGLCEIAMKKPFDPVEYLGHWLLYYRECDERDKRRKEFEAELNEERLKYMEPSRILEPSDSGEEHEYTYQSTDDDCIVKEILY